MVLRSSFVTYLAVLQASFLAFLVSSLERSPPVVSESEARVATGANLSILCEGNTPLTWDCPRANLTNTGDPGVMVTEVAPKHSRYKHASRLHLYNITYLYVGFYKCYEKGRDKTDAVAETYLYVEDTDYLKVDPMEDDTVYAVQYTVAVIPCRPTAPDVKVDLSNDYDGDLIAMNEFNAENHAYFRFDPRYGFITNDTRTVIETSFTCYFNKSNKSDTRSITMHIEQPTATILKPMLRELTGGHTVVGETLTVQCLVLSIIAVKFEWETPTGRVTRPIQHLLGDKTTQMLSDDLTIPNVTLADNGRYVCHVSDNQDHRRSNAINVTVYDVDAHFIQLRVASGVESKLEPAGKTVVWRIHVNGHPKPNLTWVYNGHEVIPRGESRRYKTTFQSNETALEIKGITIASCGNYTLVAESPFEVKNLSLFLNVTAKPAVDIEMEEFQMVETVGRVICIVTGNPKPSVHWYFKPCMNSSCGFSEVKSTERQKGLQVISIASIPASTSGYIKCMANNSIGNDERIQSYIVSDVEQGFDIFGFDDGANVDPKSKKITVAMNEPVQMTCGVSVYNYSSQISWFHGGRTLQDNDKYEIETYRTDYSYRMRTIIKNITVTEGGSYTCLVNDTKGRSITKNITVLVSPPRAPVINASNLDKDIDMLLPDKLMLFCNTLGVPKPVMIWYKDSERVQETNRTSLRDSNQTLLFQSTAHTDEGTYRCIARNTQGQVWKQIKLTFSNNPRKNIYLYFIIIGVLILVTLICSLTAVTKIRKERRLKRELQIAGLANFEKGALENLNPDLGIDDQAELLPYDKKWEFPIEKLKLGKQLGSGAFGVVMKGEAKGILDEGETTTVAVKMVKKNADHTYIKALASELKIMVHLGKHLNVVNLLGACTKNVAKRELLVIVEFCRFGNLQNYLLRHRENFIDQVDPGTGRLDYLIGQEELERAYSISSNRSQSQSPYMKYAALAFSSSNSGGSNVPHDMVDYRANNYKITSGRTDVTSVSMSPTTEEEMFFSTGGGAQPEWRSNYKGDYKDNVRPICTKDLLAWAFQVTRGMEYLASRRILHGDLAARNILLAENSIVKICDFGLAKSIYKSDDYKKKGDGPLPVKWMAIESIRDKVFSTQSDVWSFGIVLWEMFSLGRSPYPGMEVDERLYNKLLDGYRMEAPPYAPKEIYKMMLDCWQAKPSARPSFEKLSERIGSLLEDTVRKHYIDLNDPYLVINTQRLADGHSDYLAMLSPPNYENLSSPQSYTNSGSTTGYLCMKTPSIVSPSSEDDDVFSFELTGRNRTGNAVASTAAELVPMLALHSDSEACSSPETMPESFSNPSYLLPPIIETAKGAGQINVATNNYVNIVQSKMGMKEAKDKGEPPAYVNGSVLVWESVQV